MRQIKKNDTEKKRQASKAKPESRMDTLLQQIDSVIAKKKPQDRPKKA